MNFTKQTLKNVWNVVEMVLRSSESVSGIIAKQ